MMERVTDPNLIKQLDTLRSSQSNDDREKVTDPELIKRLDAERAKQSPQEGSRNLFKINDPTVMGKVAQDLRENPKEAGKALIQSVGMLGMAAVPELTLMKGAGMIPGAVNALSRSGISGGLGAMASPENPLEGGVIGAAIPPATRLLTKTLPALIKNTTPEKVGKYLQEGYSKLKGKAETLFDTVRDEATKRGINLLPVGKSFIDSLSPYLAKTDATKELLKKAQTGDYESLRKVQTDLFTRGTKKWNSQADMDKAARGMEKRKQLNDFIHDHFKNTGHQDLASQLNEARNLYRELEQTYHHKKLPQSIKDIYDPEVWPEKFSPKILETLSKGTKPLNRLIAQNPMVGSELEKGVGHQNALKSIKRLGIGTIGGTSTLGLMEIADLAKNLLKKE